MAFPPYSRRLISFQNSGGDLTFTNPGPNLYLIRNVTVYNAALSPDDIWVVDGGGARMIYFHSPGTISTSGLASSQVFTELHLVWPAGDIIEVVTGTEGWDFTAHGYELTKTPV